MDWIEEIDRQILEEAGGTGCRISGAVSCRKGHLMPNRFWGEQCPVCKCQLMIESWDYGSGGSELDQIHEILKTLDEPPDRSRPHENENPV